MRHINHVRCHGGGLPQIFANDANDDSYFTDGHLVAEERTLMLSDGVGDITAVDLRTNKQVPLQFLFFLVLVADVVESFDTAQNTRHSVWNRAITLEACML